MQDNREDNGQVDLDRESRYARQVLFSGIGPEGQPHLREASVVLVGAGALGSVSASLLVRAGIGHLRVVDRDFLELHNLQRQVLYVESDLDLDLPKAVLAERHLREMNSEVEVEGVAKDFCAENALELAAGADLLLDGLDNFESRYLLNDVSLKLGIPWVYGGAIQSAGVVASFLPGRPPCLRCLMSVPPPGPTPTCDTAGVIAPAPATVASLQAAEVLKILTGNAGAPSLLSFDVWSGEFDRIDLSGAHDPDCPACAGTYDFLDGRIKPRVDRLCGQSSVQIWNPRSQGLDLAALAEQLSHAGQVQPSGHMLRFRPEEDRELVIFYDGRVVVRGTTDVSEAKSLYAKYLGS